ncbi:MAG: Cystathionine gamma-lyase [uncultured Thermomicrobiales bacterium]|uniref:Cystathionine gamma-lyase n=1 Tax=uncultured Thermomicrobiales bacterium TaxID=1645740 RepID=A0A6J4TS16_9BACT|nr:MAG: Cystathionine gamma-lyase [uncultured Thermomicrobiales bacterium]
MDKTSWGTATIAARGGYEPALGEGVVPGIQPSSTFVVPGNPGEVPHAYARGGSPAYEPLERAMAALEGGADAVVFSAGMAAAIALLDEAAPGTAVVMPGDAYYGIRVWAEQELPKRGVEVRIVDPRDRTALERALPGASLLWAETPTNPHVAITDLAEIAALAAAHGVPWICDNTFATPILQRPIADGALATMHSLTKYVGGHGDLVLGAAACAGSDLAARLRARRNRVGTQPDAFSCWLARRGVQTLPLRIRRQSATALVLARCLAAHPKIARVHYPGLPDDPGYVVASRQMDGAYGAIVSIVVDGGAEAAQAVVDNVRLWIPATSLGGVESLIERRARWAGEVADPALLRLSVGVEEPEDLWRDLERALA